MLQDYYEKHNLEMKPYKYYLAEFQNVNPKEVTSRLDIPFDDNSKSFTIKFMQNTYTISYPEFEIHCIDKSDKDAVLCNDIHAKILMLRYFSEGDYMKAAGDLSSYRDLPWGEVYYRQFYGRCIMRLAKTYGNRQDVFKRLMEKLAGRRQKYGEVSYEFEVFRELKLCFILWSGDEEFPPSAQILFSDNFPMAFAAEDVAYLGDVILDYMKQEEFDI